MSLERDTLARAVAEHGPVARVVVADVQGSTPREVGAAMLVWADGQHGTIGGGALEYEAAAKARAQLTEGRAHALHRVPLGPGLGQCCGGAVTLLTEVWDEDGPAALTGPLYARPVQGDRPEPLAVARLRAQARASGARPAATLTEGWFIEPISAAKTPLWIWGAGHVGRALVAVMAPLPDIAITWVDTGPERFPDDIPEGVTALPAPEIAAAVRLAPTDAHHIVMTYSHPLDLALCDALLTHGFAGAGLIGSDTKRARFRSRLDKLGHRGQDIARIDCPIGDKSLGKHPQAIAVGVARELLSRLAQTRAGKAAPGDNRGDGRDDTGAVDA
ncbi:xanthine dehydrogenase accessory protein XdhC [Maritimibacter fusiformis]|uniref:Xanthine dehydrogenase accessory protein XdhC n=1 Tax=Maritimibacter fusiformis TaxID=2603819 RepID=A0A5D0RR56_9RHOB|nr:xanthine dehydrogenase accessory protein XdhC [Maritimibacter fusiformis]TYB83158.1 xanthine dehydrogenase accessory protein XdhC [Maritimibacter fusiformis]